MAADNPRMPGARAGGRQRRSRRRWRLGLVMALLVISAGNAHGGRASPDEAPLSLGEAMRATLAHHPTLKAYRLRRDALRGEQRMAALRPPWQVTAELENFAGSGEAAGTEQLVTTLALSKVIELGGQRAGRIAVADARTEKLAVARQAEELDVLAEVARRYVHVAADEARQALAHETVELARDMLGAVTRRVQAARSPAAQRARARAALARAELGEEHAEHELRAARVRLSALWGAIEPELGPTTAELLAVGAPGDLEAMMSKVEANPDIAIFNRESRLHEAELALARARGGYELELSAGVRYLEASDDTALVAGARLPLFSASRARGAIEAAEARLGAVEYDRAAALVRTKASLYSIYQERIHAITQVQSLRETVIPQLTDALEEIRLGYERGRYSYLDWVSAQRELIDARAALIDAAARAHVTRIDLERLSGAPLRRTLPTHQDNGS